MKDNDHIISIYLYSYSHKRINVSDIYNTIVPSVRRKIRMKGWHKRDITIQREQYLFIGAGRSPETITFMPLTFTYNHNAGDQGLNSLFPLSR
jgi:hypothetical protein